MAKCECSECGKLFKSLFGFDAHRVGKYSIDPKSRRCLSDKELEKKGFIKRDNLWLGATPNIHFAVSQ